MKKLSNKAKWEAFCSSWISISSCAVVDANRRISAAGARATAEMMARTGGVL